MLVKDLLKANPKKLIMVDESTEILEAMRLLIENRISSLLIADSDNTLKGIISDKDIFKVCYEKHCDFTEMTVTDIMTTNVIETQGLTVYYGKHRGILDVNLSVEKGEVFGFLGPNGAGKTTTQRVLLDIFPPTKGQATIFGLGIMPYISASIIFQLLGSVWGPLERLQKEGESGRKKINEYTRYATIVLCLGQSWFYVVNPCQWHMNGTVSLQTDGTV